MEVGVVGHVAAVSLLHAIMYVVFFAIHEEFFIEESDFLEHLLADEEAGAGEVHQPGQIAVGAVGQCGEDGGEVAVEGVGTGDGIGAGFAGREHLLDAVHAEAAVGVKGLEDGPEQGFHEPYVGIHDEDDGRRGMADSEVVALSVASVAGVAEQDDIWTEAMVYFGEHGIGLPAVVIYNDDFKLFGCNVGMPADGFQTVVDVAFGVVGDYDDGESFHLGEAIWL